MLNLLVELGVVFIMITISLGIIIIVSYVVVILLEIFIGFFDAGYLIAPHSTDYVCKNKYRKWVNALRFMGWVIVSYIPEKCNALGFYFGEKYYSRPKRKSVWVKMKNKIIYSTTDTCKD